MKETRLKLSQMIKLPLVTNQKTQLSENSLRLLSLELTLFSTTTQLMMNANN